MNNNYQAPEVIEVGEAQCIILGAKQAGLYDSISQSPGTVVNPQTDIDE
jgi:hypothetical protein